MSKCVRSKNQMQFPTSDVFFSAQTGQFEYFLTGRSCFYLSHKDKNLLRLLF